MEREYRRTPDWPEIQTPLTGYELAEIWQDGEQRQGPLSVLGGVPSAHAASHKFGGSDVVGTQDKTANAIPITDGSGTLDVFVSDASTTKKGKVQLAANGERVAGKALQSNDVSTTNARTPTAHAGSHIGGSDDLGLKGAAFKEVGTPGGVCPLNASSQVDSGYLPSYVDDVIEAANFAALPVTGETGKIYVTLDDNLTYRWSGSAYVEISKSLALGETSSTAYRGDRGKTAYDHSQATGNPHGTAIADISTLTGKITPLSDLSRVFRLTGDGIPIFPDNVAGRTYWQDDWATTDGFSGINCTPTVSGGALIATASGTAAFSVRKTGMSYTNRLVRIKFKSFTRVGLYKVRYHISTTLYEDTQFTVVPGQYIYDVYLQTSGTYLSLDVFCSVTGSAGDSFQIDTIYIGSGLYDTPVYDKACCNRFTNNGVLSVPAPRGLGMLFQGAQYLRADNTVLGTTGTIFISFAVGALSPSATKILVDGRNSSFKSGITVYQLESNVIQIGFADASGMQNVSIGTVTSTGRYTVAVAFTPSSAIPFFNGVQGTTTAITVGSFASLTNLQIGARSTLAADGFFNGTIYDIGFDSRLWTADDALRYHNGDDAVDSQQKAVTAVPHSIVTRKSDGRTEVATAVDNLDAVNKAQLDAACADFLYQTYTAGSTFTAGQLGYLHTDGKVYLYDANAEASAKGALYIAFGAITANNVGTFQRGGEYTTTGLSAGAIYYGSETPGEITTTPPATPGAIVRKIGFAQSSTVLFFNPSNDYTTVTSVSGISQTITSFNPSVQFAGGEVGVAYTTRKGYVVTTGKQIEYNVDIQLTSKGSSTGQFSVACPDPPAAVFGVASASVFVSAVSYSGHLQATLIGSRFYLSQLSEAGVASDLTNANIANNSVIRLHGVLVAQ